MYSVINLNKPAYAALILLAITNMALIVLTMLFFQEWFYPLLILSVLIEDPLYLMVFISLFLKLGYYHYLGYCISIIFAFLTMATAWIVLFSMAYYLFYDTGFGFAITIVDHLQDIEIVTLLATLPALVGYFWGEHQRKKSSSSS
jgi:hypothetical protein